MVAEVVGIPLVLLFEFFSVFFRVSRSCSGSLAAGVVESVVVLVEGDFRFLEAEVGVLAACFCSALRSLSSLPIAGRATVSVFLPLVDAEAGFVVEVLVVALAMVEESKRYGL